MSGYVIRLPELLITYCLYQADSCESIKMSNLLPFVFFDFYNCNRKAESSSKKPKSRRRYCSSRLFKQMETIFEHTEDKWNEAHNHRLVKASASSASSKTSHSQWDDWWLGRFQERCIFLFHRCFVWLQLGLKKKLYFYFLLVHSTIGGWLSSGHSSTCWLQLKGTQWKTLLSENWIIF